MAATAGEAGQTGPDRTGAVDHRRHEPIGTDRRLRRVWIAYGGLGALLLAYMISEFLRRAGQSWPLIDDWGVAIFEIVASLLCIYRA